MKNMKYFNLNAKGTGFIDAAKQLTDDTEEVTLLRMLEAEIKTLKASGAEQAKEAKKSERGS